MRGFSLIECVIALACGAILLTVSVPGIRRFQQEWALWGGMKTVEASLYWGRTRAIAANSPMAFIVREDGRQFWWSDSSSSLPYEKSFRRLDGVRIASCPKKPLRFYQHGNAAPAGTFVVQGEKGSYSVIVSPGGRIRVQKN